MTKPRRKKKQNVARPEPTTPAKRRSMAWLALLILPIALYCLWRAIPNLTTSDSDLETAAEQVQPIDEESPADGQAESKHQTVPVTTDASVTVPAPGSTQQDYVGPLADAYRRIDPTADGWHTEAFNESSGKQVKYLAKLFESQLNESILKKLITDDFACSPLQPTSLHEVFEDKTLQVRRAESLGENAAVSQFRGSKGLRTAVEQFRQLYVNGAIERTKLKPVRVSVDNGEATSTLDFQSVGRSDAGTLQVNATWNLQWTLAEGALPRLKNLKVVEYESVLHRGQDAQLFSDCTASVLGNTVTYNQQFLRSTDYWRARVSRDLGLDPVANHGLAIGDVNGDGLEDLYVCQQGGLPNRLFIQNANGTLRDQSAESGANWLDYCASALLVDFDNDGDRDLIVAQEWRILLMSNDGKGHFQLEFGTSSEAQTFSLSAADFDLDGDIDVYTCGYNPTASTLRRGAMGEPIPYHDANNGGQNMLLRNEGNWLFNDVAAEVGLNKNNTRFSFAAAWEDYDNDGDPDLYVANDYGRNNLFQNNNGKFVDVAPDLQVEDMSAGMSASWADANRDGRMDLYVSNMFSAAGNRITYQRQFKNQENRQIREQFQRHARGNSLFVNTGDGFRDVSEPAGVTMGRWAWGSRFADINGDGWEDLLVANGFISTPDTGDL